MKKSIFIFVMFIALSMFSNNVIAQATSNHSLNMGIPEVCLLGTDAAAITLQLTTNIAGDQISGGAGIGYAQVSSIVGAAETRTINASITGVPAGTTLSVDTSIPNNGNQGGELGTGTTGVALVNAAAAVTLVTAIGSCYTGNASTDGYELGYTWDAATGTYGSIAATVGSTATVVLTITNTP